MANNEPGPGVDAQGRPAPDPTENVKDLMKAAIERIDDLLGAAVQRNDDLRALEAKYQRVIMDLIAAHQKDVAVLRGYFGEQLRLAEAKRIDAIRTVDVAAVQQAAEVASLQASTLATTLTQTAETLRVQVQVTAAAAQTAVDAMVTPMKAAIEDLRRAQYEAQGQKTQVVEARSASGANVALFGLGISILLALIVVITVVVSRGGA
jgi:hypothetical protein